MTLLKPHTCVRANIITPPKRLLNPFYLALGLITIIFIVLSYPLSAMPEQDRNEANNTTPSYTDSAPPFKEDKIINNTKGSIFVANAEHEAIIAKAEKKGIDPIDFGIEMKKNGNFTFNQYRKFSKYCVDRARHKGYELDLQLKDQAKQFIEIFTNLRSSGRFSKKEVDILLSIYNSPLHSTETKLIIKERFPELFQAEK